MLVVLAATIALTVELYIKTPKGYLPAGRHRPGLRLTRASPDISFKAMVELQQQGARHRPGRPGRRRRRLLGRRVGLQCGGQPRPHVHQPEAARRARRPDDRSASSTACAPKFAQIPGIEVFMFAGAGRARRRRAEPFAISVHAVEPRYRRAADNGCRRWSTASSRCRASSTSRPTASRAASSSTSRSTAQAAARLGVRMQDIDAALNNAFAQRQISTIYTPRNQYRVILEVDPHYPARSGRSVAHLRRRARRHAGAARPAWRASSAASRRWWSTIRASFRRSPSPSGCAEGVALEDATPKCSRRCRHAHARHHPRRIRRRRARPSPHRPARSRC